MYGDNRVVVLDNGDLLPCLFWEGSGDLGHGGVLIRVLVIPIYEKYSKQWHEKVNMRIYDIMKSDWSYAHIRYNVLHINIHIPPPNEYMAV